MLNGAAGAILQIAPRELSSAHQEASSSPASHEKADANHTFEFESKPQEAIPTEDARQKKLREASSWEPTILRSDGTSEKTPCLMTITSTETRTGEDVSGSVVLDNLEPRRADTSVPFSVAEKRTTTTKITLRLLTIPRFYLVVLTHIAMFVNMSTYLTVIVDFATDRNFPKWDAVSLISMYMGADLAARLGGGWITDRKYLSRTTWTSLNLVSWSSVFLLVPACRVYYGQALMSVVSGWCNGCILAMIPVLYSEVTCDDQYAFCFGMGSFVVGIVGLLRPILVGKLRRYLQIHFSSV